MNYYLKYTTNIINYDLLNKFQYNTIFNYPKIIFLKLSFNVKHHSLKQILLLLTSLEILSYNKGFISLKIKKGYPITFSVSLRKKNLYEFILFLINTEKVGKLNYKVTSRGFVLTRKIPNLLILPEFENNYNIFKNLDNLKLCIYTNIQSKEEVDFLIKSYKLNKAIVT